MPKYPVAFKLFTHVSKSVYALQRELSPRTQREGENVKVGTGITATDEMHIEKLLKGTRSPQ